MRVFNGVDELRAAKGTEVGVSEWFTVAQERIDGFADATEDHQWIHVDAAKAADGPFGTTIAHGFLTLSLLSRLVPDVYRIDGVRMGVNYGLNKVRFPAPVPVGSRIRAQVTLDEIRETGAGLQLTTTYTIEIEGKERPACVAERLTLVVP